MYVHKLCKCLLSKVREVETFSQLSESCTFPNLQLDKQKRVGSETMKMSQSDINTHRLSVCNFFIYNIPETFQKEL